MTKKKETILNFQTKLDNYAELLVVHGMNVQTGQNVNVTGEIIHRELMQKIAVAAYRRGARYVNLDFIDPLSTKIRIQESLSQDYLKYVPSYIPVKFESFIDDSTAILRLVGSEDPDCLSDLSPKLVNDVQGSYRKSLKKYYSEGVGKSKFQWNVAAAATPKWAKKVYPELEEEEALQKLWNAIFQICRVDQPNYLEIWKEHDHGLKERAHWLTNLKIKFLHFTGPGTDLKVYLSPKAIFKGGGDTTPENVDFEPNIPTEECFTTPDCRLTEGHVFITRPVLVNGTLVKDLRLEFQSGEITKYSAAAGQDTFGAYISNDPGAKFLGEVALVGIDSPIYQTRRVFEEILFDENAACHIAIGLAYRFCLEDGNTISDEELANLGCNSSSVHTDFMISSDKVNVNAKTYSGTSVELIRNGQWISFKHT